MLPITISPEDLQMHHISAGDTVRLGVLAGPEVPPVTVILESWDERGSQPPNSHPVSTELFLFLKGQGIANCDGGDHVAERCLTGLVLLRVKGPESTPITPNVTLEPAALARAAGDAITTHIAGLSQWNGLATRTPS